MIRNISACSEGVVVGNAKLVGISQELKKLELTNLITDPSAYAAMSEAKNPYGDGKASKQIADALTTTLD